ncbi:MAG TPA: MarR family transcriptional regulator [Candidatus Paceibacterota bacterium]|nr:MarR family transcriptional regulator [Candidatus Paceibacterota bacterium]
MQEHATTLNLFLDVGRAIKRDMGSALPLPFAQCEALKLVEELPRASMREVARTLRITAPSATSLIDELARQGYLKRGAAREDRRRIALTLTPKGKRIASEIMRKRKAVFARLLQPLDHEDRENLNRVLRKIINSQ